MKEPAKLFRISNYFEIIEYLTIREIGAIVEANDRAMTRCMVVI